MMIIFCHRGLEPSKKNFYPESSYEAFESQIFRGFGLEFDLNFVSDGIIVSHDLTLERITSGEDKRDFSEVKFEELKDIRYGGKIKGRVPSFEEILKLIKDSNVKLHALHLKGRFQETKHLDLIVEIFKKDIEVLEKILIFDLKPGTAKYLRQRFPKLNLAPSVSHQYDIKRYNKVVNNTLISVEDAINYKKEGIYDWVWLDEWDLVGENEKRKTLYNKKVFDKLKKIGYKIALVTPELHGTSPGLLGYESHGDSRDKKTLFKRINEIISLKPDAICTDYSLESKTLAKNFSE